MVLSCAIDEIVSPPLGAEDAGADAEDALDVGAELFVAGAGAGVVAA
jgi:hypothetical protein